MWIPNDIGLHGNTGIDQYDKVELNDTVSYCSILITDLKPFILKFISKR